MAKIEIKKPVVEEISASIKDAQSVVLVDYRGLTVEQDTKLRKELREAGEQVCIDEHIGFIKFGSRVDIYLPLDTEILVKLGDITTGGITQVARLKKQK